MLPNFASQCQQLFFFAQAKNENRKRDFVNQKTFNILSLPGAHTIFDFLLPTNSPPFSQTPTNDTGGGAHTCTINNFVFLVPHIRSFPVLGSGESCCHLVFFFLLFWKTISSGKILLWLTGSG